MKHKAQKLIAGIIGFIAGILTCYLVMFHRPHQQEQKTEPAQGWFVPRATLKPQSHEPPYGALVFVEDQK
jgi:hypothetical protein